MQLVSARVSQAAIAVLGDRGKETVVSDSRVPPVNKVRFVTAASLFDGHDAAINIMRRILQAQGAEVIHLGHNRSVAEGLRKDAIWTWRQTSRRQYPKHH